MYKIYEIYNGAIITSVIFANYGPMTLKTQTSQLRRPETIGKISAMRKPFSSNVWVLRLVLNCEVCVF